MQRKINSLLKTDYIGKVVRYENEMDSTNKTLLELGEKGASEGTVVIADRQTAGRGRLDRKWISPPGCNLYISILFRPELAASEATLFTLIASIGLLEAVNKLKIAGANIKWPNDIQINKKKAAGILTEMRPRREVVDYLVVGIGVNVNMNRESINNLMGNVGLDATSLKEHLGRDIDRAKFAADLMLELEKWHKVYREKGKSNILREWTERWADLNKWVHVESKEESYEGAAIGIDAHGYLMVKTDNEEIKKVISGDVTVL